jgi:hypothetical protein
MAVSLWVFAAQNLETWQQTPSDGPQYLRRTKISAAPLLKLESWNFDYWHCKLTFNPVGHKCAHASWLQQFQFLRSEKRTWQEWSKFSIYAVLNSLCTIPDDGQSNRPKYAVEIWKIYQILIRCVILSIKIESIYTRQQDDASAFQFHFTCIRHIITMSVFLSRNCKYQGVIYSSADFPNWNVLDHISYMIRK